MNKKSWYIGPAIAVILLLLSINYYKDKSSYTKPDFDSKAITGVPSLTEEDDYKELSPEGLYNIYLSSTPNLISNKLYLYFTNDESNNVYLKVKIYKENKLVGESGLVKPGEYIKYINVKNITKNDEIIIKVLSYNKDSYYSEGTLELNMEIK